MDADRKDFFISYNSANADWAEWIGHVLEDDGYSVVIQAWDFRPGSNFVMEMQKALRQSARMIAVLSPAYLKASFPQAEWAAAFAADPEGAKRALVPVMVQKCEPTGLLSQVVHINLVDLDSEAAASRLLAGVKTGRAKPSTRPTFPGSKTSSASVTEVMPTVAGRLTWLRQATPVAITWRSDLDGRLPNQNGYEAVELHLVPVGDEARLQVKELAELSAALPDIGRRHQLFSSTEELDASADASKTWVLSKERGKVAGLTVTRSGQRTAWTALPRGTIGAILDEEHLVSQLKTMLDVLTSLPIPAAGLVVPAAGLEPANMISIGKVGVVSNSASFGHGMPRNVRPVAEDAVSFAEIGRYAQQISAELAARIVAEHRSAARIL
ncbi:toll/interleukin-1 receptor domain-containing protein [Catelliglobosispora koreensis]|uniref:toll/interleukin-1 receptor domain-containing protein n=1 Tax=Catelliglobosispora koreensis TaxID=129052 RepID=UPI00035FEC62|nr:toll/interleukin-1 receptor domain-containing protein [Catelliglobosispora koreensis]